MDWLSLSTTTLIAGALLLAVIAGGQALWRRIKKPNKDTADEDP